MATVASPAIIFNRNPETGRINDIIDPILDNLYKTRLRSFERVVLYRKPNDEIGEFTFGSINNKLHRSAVEKGYYLTHPVIVNYKNALTEGQVTQLLNSLNLCDKGHVYYVEVDENAEYTVDLLVAKNVEYKTLKDIVRDRFNT